MFEVTWHKLWCIVNESGKRNIYIWGAGSVARQAYRKLKLLDREPAGFIVDRDGEEDRRRAEELSKAVSPEEALALADGGLYIILPGAEEEVCRLLCERGMILFRDYRVLRDFETAPYFPYIFPAMESAAQGEERKKLPAGKTPCDPALGSLEMYVLTHRKCPVPGGCYRALQVGSALHERLPYIQDDTGEHISDKNPSFCELTGLYWIWKNVRADFIGLCHYRRYFVNEKGEVLNEKEIRNFLKEYDIILPEPMVFKSMNHECIPDSLTTMTQYQQDHYMNDLITAGEYIAEHCPEYKASFRRAMESRRCFGYNMMAARKEIFDSYCSWLFPILFYLESVRQMIWEDRYQNRVFGFLSERLFNVWLEEQHFNIITLPVIKKEYEDGGQ